MIDKPFTAKYLYELLSVKQLGNSVNRIGATLFNSKIRLTPHQIEAALFAFKSPLNKGTILADEVGLGKTIEAGIVLAQYWSERKRRLLIVTPASLMRQWSSELLEKFNLPSAIMDRKNYNSLKREGFSNPFELKETIIICSYQMCATFKDDIMLAHFDLCVIDEAHKLRNVWTGNNVISNAIREALFDIKKVLLTATPIQNNVMDFYGLASFIDNDFFGDSKIYREKYLKNYYENHDELRDRLSLFTHRTLRQQVQPYVKFTDRIPKTFSFKQSKEEELVYSKIQELLLSSNEDSYLIPNRQKHLLLMILCKLMGSSVHSIVGTLETMRNRLLVMRDTGLDNGLDFLEDDYDEEPEEEVQETIDIDKIDKEIANLTDIISIAKRVQVESKYIALKDAITFAESHLKKLHANDKILIFTESRRTQQYLYDSLLADGYDEVIMFNGSNDDELSAKIYGEWLNKPANKEKLNNSKAINMREAIVDYFKTSGKILIATGAGAEGLNLQFCSMVINYDLPWNPQVVEQRIGRCHRFGQEFDVVVINFLSANNTVEQRIYELLSSKFRVFNEIFGSSDAILGTLEEGVDLEKSIVEIYTHCRTTDEINKAFDEIQEKYKDVIDESINKTRQELFDNFDEDIQKYFADLLTDTKYSISRVEELFWQLTKIVLANASFNEETKTFSYDGKSYCISILNDGNYIDYNMNSILGQDVLKEASLLTNSSGHIIFNLSSYPFKLSDVKPLLNKNGILSLNKMTIDSFEKEEILYLSGVLSDGTPISEEVLEKLFRLSSLESDSYHFISAAANVLNMNVSQYAKKLLLESEERNNELLNAEIAKINKWSEDKIESVQLKVEEMRNERKNLQKQSDIAENTYEKEILEERILSLSKKIRLAWMELADAEEEIEKQRNAAIKKLRQQLMKESKVDKIFEVSFEVI